MNDVPAVERLRLRTAPALAAAGAFALGILCARRFHAPALLLADVMALAALTLFACVRAKDLAVWAGLATMVAAGCWCAQIEPPVAQHRELLAYADGLSRTVRGHVLRVRSVPAVDRTAAPTEESAAPWLAAPGAWEAATGEPTESIDLAIDAVEDVTPDTSAMRPIAGGVRVTVLGGRVEAHCGDEFEAPLRMRVPDALRDPGAFSDADQLAGQGIEVLAAAKSGVFARVGQQPREFRCAFFAAQAWATARLAAFPSSAANRRLPRALQMQPSDAAMLGAMLFGDRAGLTRTLKDGFERTGTFHLFVVSGLHVALLAGGLLWMLRRLRLRDAAAIPLTLAVTAGYALLTGFGAPVERALFMTAAYLVARLIAREAHALQALGIAALLALALDPRALYEASFQMTSLVIFAVAGLGSPLWERTLQPYEHAAQTLARVESDAAFSPALSAFRVRLRMWHTLVKDLLGPFAARCVLLAPGVVFACAELLLYGAIVECCMALPMAVFFDRVTVWALPMNVLMLPCVGVLLGCAMAFFVLLLLGPWAALLPAAATAGALHLMRAAVDRAGRFAGADVRVPPPAAGAIVLPVVLLAGACWALRERRRWVALAGVCAVLLTPLAVVWPTPPLLHRGVLEVTAIDVGQGDSLLVVSPDGHTMLVDAGGPVGGLTPNAAWDVGEDVVAPYLWTRQLRRLDVVLLTHAHSDHMGGMPAVVRDFRPRELWLSIDPGDAPGLRALEAECAALGVRVRHFHAGDALSFGDTALRVLAPEARYANAGVPVNDDSLVTELRWQRASVLLEGDAEAPSEAAMLAGGRVTPVTLLKVAHHGSQTSTGAALLAAAQPRMGVISVGRHNTFGHPRFEVLERLADAHVQTFRTDRSGATTFLLRGDGTIAASTFAAGP